MVAGYNTSTINLSFSSQYLKRISLVGNFRDLHAEEGRPSDVMQGTIQLLQMSKVISLQRSNRGLTWFSSGGDKCAHASSLL